MRELEWNTKCFIQGAFVLGVWAGSSSSQPESDQWFPKLELKGTTLIFAGLLFWATYAINALLDVNFGCEHGSFYDRLAYKG
jgi:hypothetical protein